jgi:hypothetical protein
LDEAVRVYKGKVEDWRRDRANAYLIHCSLVEKPVDIYEYLPLPFDDEILVDNSMDIEKLYNEAKELGIV